MLKGACTLILTFAEWKVYITKMHYMWGQNTVPNVLKGCARFEIEKSREIVIYSHTKFSDGERKNPNDYRSIGCCICARSSNFRQKMASQFLINFL